MIDVFVSFPYSSDDPEIIQQRVNEGEAYVAELVRSRRVVYSTITAMDHLVHKYDIPYTYEYWQHHCHVMIELSKEVHVLCMPGWEESTGVQDEIQVAKNLNKKIVYKTAW